MTCPRSPRCGIARSGGRWVRPEPLVPSTPGPAPAIALELDRRERGRGGERPGVHRGGHIRNSAQSWGPEPGKASKARDRPCVCLATHDRAKALVPSRPTLLRPPLRAREALTRLLARSRLGLQFLGDCRPWGRGVAPGLRHGVAVTAWHPLPCRAVAEADRALGPTDPAVQHHQATEARCLPTRPLVTLQN